MKAINNVHPLIQQQVPDFIKGSHPDFIQFLEHYYKWMESDGGVLYGSKTLLSNFDIDTTDVELLTFFQKEFLINIPTSVLADKRNLLKNIKQFYRARGTEKSYKLLFRILFDTPVSFYYPERDILRTSDGKWIQEKTIRVKKSIGSPLDFVSRKVTGSTSGATAIVEKVLEFQMGPYNVFELYFNKHSISGVFAPGEQIVYDSVVATTYSIITGITVTAPGAGYTVGTYLTISDSTGIGASARIKNVTPTGGVHIIEIIDPGVGYTSPTVTFPTMASQATGTANISALNNYPGYFLNEDGQLSTTKYLQDSYFYQQYSYVLESNVPINEYREVVLKLLHPSGLILFGSLKYAQNLDLSVDIVDNRFGSEKYTESTIFDYTDVNAGIQTVDAKSDLIIQIDESETSFKLGPSLRSFEKYKFRYLPSSVHSTENDRFYTPNEDYWLTYANSQIEHFADITIDDITDHPYYKSNICLDPYTTIYRLEDLLTEFDALTITGDINPSIEANITVDSANRISNLEDDRGILADFTAASGARPWKTRSDNQENLFFSSEDLADSSWAITNGSIVANAVASPIGGASLADFFKEDSATNVSRTLENSDIDFYPGEEYIVSGYVKYGGRSVLKVTFDPSVFTSSHIFINTLTATLISEEGIETSHIEVVDNYNDWIYFEAAAIAGATYGLGSITFSCMADVNDETYDGDNTSGIYLWGLQVRNSRSTSGYIESAGKINFRGFSTGKESMIFRGAQELVSTATLADPINNNSETCFFVFVPYRAEQTNGTIVASSNDRWNLYVSSGTLKFKVVDGADKILSRNIVSHQPYLVKIRHQDGLIYISVNGEEEVALAAGNINSLAGTLSIGALAGTNYFYGSIARIITDDANESYFDQNNIFLMLGTEYGIY